MGVLLILLGLGSAGLLAGFIAENDLISAPTQSFTMFGQNIDLSLSTMLISAFVMGALTVVLLVVGIGLLRGSWGRRRALKHRVADLEQQNTELRSRERLTEVVDTYGPDQAVQIPEASETTDVTSGSRPPN
jgi:hypothetical protein